MAAKEDSANISVTNINNDSKVPAECVQNADKAKDTKDEASREEKTFSSRRSETRKQSVPGKFLRRSNQTCKVSNNLTKLEGLPKVTKSASKAKVLEGLMFVLRQLLVKEPATDKAMGILTFCDAYDLYCGFMDTRPQEVQFHDHLLDQEHGLCVYITMIHKTRLIVLQNESTDIGQLLLELEHIEDKDEINTSSRYFLNEDSLSKILSSMDTEYDRMALKAVLFATHSRAETFNLGIKPDRAVGFLSKVIMACEESDRTLREAEDIFELKTGERIKKTESKLGNIDQKIVKQQHFLSEKRKVDLEERLDNLKALSIQSDQKENRRVGQATKRIANQLLESCKIKRRQCGGGAPSLLDEEDEDFIAKAIESKSTCHGRRHETTLFTHHRVKKSNFLSLANHSLSKRGKKTY